MNERLTFWHHGSILLPTSCSIRQYAAVIAIMNRSKGEGELLRMRHSVRGSSSKQGRSRRYQAFHTLQLSTFFRKLDDGAKCMLFALKQISNNANRRLLK